MAASPRIQDYGFGRMVIDGESYRSDVIVYPERVDASWWRKEGHLLVPEDLPFLPEDPPEILVVGQGKFGFMKISPELQELLNRLGVELRADKTARAVEIYNTLWEQAGRKVIGAFHLTC